MSRWPRNALLAACLTGSVAAARAETLRPLVTEDLETLGDGALELQVALDVLTDAPSPSLPLEGALLRAPIVGLNLGFGRAEVQLRAPLLQRFEPDGETVRTASGDATIATKVRLFGGHGSVPGLGARALVKLPNVDETTGIGTDSTDVTLEVLTGTTLAGATVMASVGLAILGDPVKAGSQNDKLSYGVGCFVPLGLLEVGADLHGLVAGDRGRADEWSAIAGVAKQVGPFRLDAGAGMSTREDSRSFLFTTGLTTLLRAPR